MQCSPSLQEIGVDCIFRSELEEADFILGEMQKLMQPEGQPPALVETDEFQFGARGELLRCRRRLFPQHSLAARSCRCADSSRLSATGRIQFGTLVRRRAGAGGQDAGAGTVQRQGRHREDLLRRRMWLRQWMTPGRATREATAISMLFSEAFEIPIADMLAAEQHHWELAGPEAYPLILCAEWRHAMCARSSPGNFNCSKVASARFPISSSSILIRAHRSRLRARRERCSGSFVQLEIHALVARAERG